MDSSELDTAVESTPAPETGLVQRAQGGDAEAFADLVRMYQRRAVSVAYRLLGNIEDASDASQDAFVRAYRCLDQLDDATRFGPWLLKVVSNQALNFRRARKTRSTVSLEDTAGEPGECRRAAGGTFAAHRGGDGGALPDELRGAIDAALSELPEKQRLALVLFSVEGMPQKEVAEILDCSVELVKWNVFQARKKLKDLLRDYL